MIQRRKKILPDGVMLKQWFIPRRILLDIRLIKYNEYYQYDSTF